MWCVCVCIDVGVCVCIDVCVCACVNADVWLAGERGLSQPHCPAVVLILPSFPQASQRLTAAPQGQGRAQVSPHPAAATPQPRAGGD